MVSSSPSEREGSIEPIPMAQFATVHDNESSLWLKIASNLYDVGVFLGISGLNPPRYGDSIYDLQKKSAYYSARIAAS